MAFNLLESFEEGGTIREFFLGSPTRVTATAGAALLGGSLLVAGIVRRKKRVTSKKTRSKRKKTTRKKSVVPRKGKRWYGKTRGKRIKHTKNGQPYVILASGKARFIKKSRSRSMKKRKGGYR